MHGTVLAAMALPYACITGDSDHDEINQTRPVI
jgi:hypothetical protein